MNKVANKFPVHLQGNKETSLPDNGIIWPSETDRTPNRRMMADIDNGPATIVYNTLQNSTIMPFSDQHLWARSTCTGILDDGESLL